MDTHHIHEEKIGFHSGTEEAKDWLKHGVSKEGMKKLMGEAEGGRSVEFHDSQGNKFKLEHEKGEDGESVFHVKKKGY